MATIFYSLMGEGRGHAARARAMAEELRHEHRVIIYTSFDALAFLREIYNETPNVEVRKTDGMIMEYTRGRLDLTKTVRKGLQLRWNLTSIVRQLCEDFARDRPDIVVTDFEPTVPRAAHRCGIPVMSFDHQHFLATYDLSGLPLRLRTYAWMMTACVNAFGLKQEKTVVTAFFYPPLRANHRHVVQVGPILRPLVRTTKPTLGDHVLCYFRRHTPERIIDLMVEVGRPMRVYGLGEREAHGNLTFCPISEEQFVQDLASSAAVVGAAGNQLSGETMYFGKPFLAIPEMNHHEQCINAHFVKQLGGGEWRLIEQLSALDVQQFLANLETYRENLRRSSYRFDGTADAAREIEAFLQQARK